MVIDWRAEWRRRPWWMQLLLAFCLYMTFVYLPFDLFIKPVATDQEVWFGFVLNGWQAKATEPLHWLIYAAGAWGFWHMRSWMWPWASLYCLQVAVGMLVYGVRHDGFALYGAIAFAVFLVPTIALWRARAQFATPEVR